MSKKSKQKFVLMVGAAAAGAYYLNKRNAKKGEEEFEIVNAVIHSERQTDIPMTIYHPLGVKETPLVVFVAGFNDDRTSEGKFSQLAEILLKKQITSVLFEHAGCGESKENFKAYSLSNNLLDLDRVYNYMLNHYSIDKDKLVLAAYSMGGREAVLYSKLKPEIGTLILLAPALSVVGDGELEKFFGGKDAYAELEAAAQKDGYALFEEVEGQPLKLSKEFFEDLRNLDHLNALNAFKGNLLYLQGNEDEVVTPEVSGKALQMINKRVKLNYVYLDHIDHCFSSEHSEIINNIVRDYLIKKL